MNESTLAVSSRGGLAQIGSKIAQSWTRWRTASSGEDWTLWQQARNGHSPSAVAVVRRLTPQAHGLAMQLLRRNEDAQDVVQESFLRLWNSRASETTGAQLSTFFNTIVINRCKTHLTRRYELSAEHEALVEMADARQEVGHVSDVESEAWSPAQLQAAMGRLPPRQRMALAMWAYADAEVSEIAHTLEVEVNAAHQLLYRAKANLRAVLKGST
ncbi:MAG: RNA polymerase sigma factor [Rhodoferax sp.]|nr:RNA polymerase sigma factor [Rhodoferax sp.]